MVAQTKTDGELSQQGYGGPCGRREIQDVLKVSVVLYIRLKWTALSLFLIGVVLSI